jgi:hypothetical protein
MIFQLITNIIIYKNLNIIKKIKKDKSLLYMRKNKYLFNLI